MWFNPFAAQCQSDHLRKAVFNMPHIDLIDEGRFGSVGKSKCQYTQFTIFGITGMCISSSTRASFGKLNPKQIKKL